MADYIRRDIVLKIINTVNDTSGFAGYADYCMLFNEIDTMPAANVKPVRHGRWENTSTPNQLRCSKCDVIHFIAQYPHGEINFCPNCGANMKGDVEIVRID